MVDRGCTAVPPRATPAGLDGSGRGGPRVVPTGVVAIGVPAGAVVPTASPVWVGSGTLESAAWEAARDEPAKIRPAAAATIPAVRRP